MSADVKTIKIYIMPLEYPCGPQSACCGPIGQSEEEIKGLKETIERELRVNVGLIDVKKEGIRLSDSQVLKLLNPLVPWHCRLLPLMVRLYPWATYLLSRLFRH